MKTVDFNLLCAHCRAPLEGTSLNGTCGECGAPVATTLNADLLDPREGTITVDLPCLHCDYNLRTLAPQMACPECGHAVADSLGNNALLLASPQWRQKVHRGLKLILLSGVGISGLVILWLLTASVGGSPTHIMTWLAAFLVCVLTILGFWGIYFVTTPDKTVQQKNRSSLPNTLARIAAVMVMLCLVVNIAVDNHRDSPIDVLTSIAFCLLIISAAIVVFCITLCLRQIARRADDEALVKKTTTWLRVSVVCMPLFILGILVPTTRNQAGLGLAGIAIFPALAVFMTGLTGIEDYGSLLAQSFQRDERPQNPPPQKAAATRLPSEPP